MANKDEQMVLQSLLDTNNRLMEKMIELSFEIKEIKKLISKAVEEGTNQGDGADLGELAKLAMSNPDGLKSIVKSLLKD